MWRRDLEFFGKKFNKTNSGTISKKGQNSMTISKIFEGDVFHDATFDAKAVNQQVISDYASAIRDQPLRTVLSNPKLFAKIFNALSPSDCGRLFSTCRLFNLHGNPDSDKFYTADPDATSRVVNSIVRRKIQSLMIREITAILTICKYIRDHLSPTDQLRSSITTMMDELSTTFEQSEFTTLDRSIFTNWVQNNSAFIEKIAYLDLSGLELKEIPPEIGLFTGLKELKLNGNLLESLPQEMRSLIHLVDLKLNNNKFREFPTALLTLRSLCMLDLSQNQLRDFPKYMKTMENLWDLNLDSNGIEDFPEGIYSLPALNFLNLNNNQIYRSGMKPKN